MPDGPAPVPVPVPDGPAPVPLVVPARDVLSLGVGRASAPAPVPAEAAVDESVVAASGPFRAADGPAVVWRRAPARGARIVSLSACLDGPGPPVVAGWWELVPEAGGSAVARARVPDDADPATPPALPLPAPGLPVAAGSVVTLSVVPTRQPRALGDLWATVARRPPA